VRSHRPHHGLGLVNGDADHGHLGGRRGFLGPQYRIPVNDQRLVTEIAKEAHQHPSDLAVPPDDRHRARGRPRRHLGAQCRLLITAGTQEHTKDRLDLTGREPQLHRPIVPILQHLLLPQRIPNANTVLPLPGRHFSHERHASGEDLEQVAIERVDHGPHHGQRARRRRVALRGAVALPAGFAVV